MILEAIDCKIPDGQHVLVIEHVEQEKSRQVIHDLVFLADHVQLEHVHGNADGAQNYDENQDEVADVGQSL